jgi:hypothetical protein
MILRHAQRISIAYRFVAKLRLPLTVQDAALVMDNLQGALDSLPPFSLLYRKTYRSVYQDEPPPSRRASPRILPLVVCLGHG